MQVKDVITLLSLEDPHKELLIGDWEGWLYSICKVEKTNAYKGKRVNDGSECVVICPMFPEDIRRKEREQQEEN